MNIFLFHFETTYTYPGPGLLEGDYRGRLIGEIVREGRRRGTRGRKKGFFTLLNREFYRVWLTCSETNFRIILSTFPDMGYNGDYEQTAQRKS